MGGGAAAAIYSSDGGREDRERYQSIFAREKGAVAAPTASLHFDAALVAKLDAMGVERAFVTLHVGRGRFSRCGPRILTRTRCMRSGYR